MVNPVARMLSRLDLVKNFRNDINKFGAFSWERTEFPVKSEAAGAGRREVMSARAPRPPVAVLAEIIAEPR